MVRFIAFNYHNMLAKSILPMSPMLVLCLLQGKGIIRMLGNSVMRVTFGTSRAVASASAKVLAVAVKPLRLCRAVPAGQTW